MEEEITLSDEQKLKILKAFNEATDDSPPSLKKMTEDCFGKCLDGRSKEGKAIKDFLLSRQLKAKAAHEYVKKTEAIALDSDQKVFIAENADTKKPLQITRELFLNDALSPLSSEFRVVNEYYLTLDPKVRGIAQDAEEPKEKEYKPPKTEEQAIARVNKYVLNGIDPKNLKRGQQERLKALVKFMHIHRFIIIMGQYSAEDRELFESSFVRFVNDKPDLSEEELDLYLNLCGDIVNHKKLQKELNSLSDIRDEKLENKDSISGALVDQIGRMYSELDSNLKRQKQTLEDLNGKRSKRLELQQKDNESIINLISLWMDKYDRDRLIALADKRKEALKLEVERLSDMAAVKAEIFGLSEEEAVRG
jgi:hypothetical protein